MLAELINLNEWDIWSPSFERVGSILIDGIRRQEGEDSSSLDDTPGHLLESEDLVLAQGLLAVVMLFQWDAEYVPSGAMAIFRVSHDGYVEVLCRDSVVEARLRLQFEEGGWSPKNQTLGS